MSDTPETDAAADWYLAAAYSTDPEDKTVPLSVSRKLERERDEAREYADKLAEGLPDGMLPKDVEVLREANLGLATELAAITAQRDEWAKLCGQYKQERDEAIRHLENHTASTIHSCHNQCQRPMCMLRRERDEAIEKHRFAVIHWQIGVFKMQRERDEAREALENLKSSLDQIASLYESKEMTATVCQRISDAYDMRCIARQAIDQLKEGAK